jgi:hypothetical protein
MSLAERQERAARNQSLFRYVNERVKSVLLSFGGATDETSFACECADPECAVFVPLTLEEYEQVRSRPDTFLVAPGHVYAEVEDVLAENERYTIVAKLERGAEVSAALDPRAGPGS